MRFPNRSLVVATALVPAVSALAYGAGELDARLPSALSAGLVAGGGVLTLAGVLALLRGVRQSAERTKQAGKTIVRLERKMDRALVRIDRRVGGLEDMGAAWHAECLRAVTRAHDLVERGFARVDGQVDRGYRSLEREIRRSYAQLEAFTDLRALIVPRAPLPPLRGWAASPDVLRMMAGWILRTHPKTIVECGSGSSSVWMGYLAERIGATIIALEHDPRYAEASRDLVRAHGLSGVVEVRDAPLQPWESEGRTYPWYSLDALDDIEDVGLVFVDGPPGDTGPDARYPALPLLLPRCAEQVAIFLDDAAREGDRAVSDHWAARFPEVVRTVHAAEKGLDVFVRSGA
ncbi:class I SAM-dependent methyltransferase [Streptosporangium sp. NPDC051022]|uniref:class I SAM-dependent methyltransferase n=1 Tax=Streptosporangium sp. NPDC051022 TaxID=3155752 RepID=UPI0034216E1B